jgi:hypothetical protein
MGLGACYAEIHREYIATVKLRTALILKSHIFDEYSYDFADGEVYNAIVNILKSKNIDYLSASQLNDVMWDQLLTKDNLISAILSVHFENFKTHLSCYREELNDASIKNEEQSNLRMLFVNKLSELIPENIVNDTLSKKILVCKALANELDQTNLDALKDKNALGLVSIAGTLLRIGIHSSVLGYLHYDRLVRDKLSTQPSMQQALRTIWAGRTLSDMRLSSYEYLINRLVKLQEAITHEAAHPPR